MFSVLKFEDMQENYDENCGITYVLLVADVCLLLMAFANEYRQAKKRDKDYLNLWNIIDLCAAAFSWTITLCILIRCEIPDFRTLRILASFASLFLFLKLYDWMRIFDPTAFYIQLLTWTLKDIKPFIFLLLLGMMTFGFSMLFIFMNWDKSDDTNIIAAFEACLYDLYLIMLGEFPFDKWDTKESVELAIMTTLFLPASFLSMVCLLNMLIAIMSKTFENVDSKKASNRMRAILKFISDFENMELSDKSRWMYIIKPASSAICEED